MEKMQGDWKILTAERSGKPCPKEELISLGFKVRDNNFVIIAGRPEPAAVELNPKSMPAEFQLKVRGGQAGKKLLGIYELKGDKLKICWAVPGKPRPKKFKTGDGQFLFVMEKRKQRENDPSEKTRKGK